MMQTEPVQDPPTSSIEVAPPATPTTTRMMFLNIPLAQVSQPNLLTMSLANARLHMERAYFRELLIAHNGSVKRVAYASGVERTHLYRKLKTLGVRS